MLRPSLRAGLVCRGAMLLALGVLGTGAGLGGEQPPNPLDILPGPQGEPGPEWLRAGLRLTYASSGVGTVMGDRISKMGGSGFTQIDVVALDTTSAVLNLRAFNLASPGGDAALLASAGTIGTPADGADWWISPARLKAAKEITDPKLAANIIRMGYPLKGKTYRAIRFQYEQYQDEAYVRVARVYDEGTGILLFRSETTKSIDVQTAGVQQSQSTFESCRALPIPWGISPAPTWVQTTSLLGYEGQMAVMIPGMQPAIRFLSVEIKTTRRGATWTQFSVASEQGGGTGEATPAPPRAKTTWVCGSAQFGGIWMPPQAFPAMAQGQVLDRDPFTKFEVKVKQVGKRPDGLDVVVLAESNGLQHHEYTYDRGSGILLDYTRTDLEPQEIRTTLQLKKRE